MAIAPTAPIVRGTVSIGVWAMNDETPPHGRGCRGWLSLGFLPTTGDVTLEHVVEVSLPTPAALAPTTAVLPASNPLLPSPSVQVDAARAAQDPEYRGMAPEARAPLMSLYWDSKLVPSVLPTPWPPAP